MNFLKSLLFFTLCFYASLAWANDARMTVAISKQAQPNIKQAMQQAWPILLNRLLPRELRSTAKPVIVGTDFIVSLSNKKKKTYVFFHDQRVSQAFKSKGVHWFQRPPRLNLNIKMTNLHGQPMSKSRLFMTSAAKEIAHDWGIELSDAGKSLSLHWQWQQKGMVDLQVESQGATYSETRYIDGETSVPLMKAWLKELMLKARDAQFVQYTAEQIDVVGKEISGEKTLVLKRNMNLEEVVSLERAFRSEVNVRSLQAVSYSKQRQVYHLELSTKDDAWLLAWFQARGMTPQRSEQGWIIR
ncbi:MAG: hypothetical protein Q9M28_00505 [Mariprofundaceae bacterium]|nr:hypothetical protein [Mariprofundaceae bacterium]